MDENTWCSEGLILWNIYQADLRKVFVRGHQDVSFPIVLALLDPERIKGVICHGLVLFEGYFDVFLNFI